MYSQTYDVETPIPLIATNFIVVKASDGETKREDDDKVILEIGKPDEAKPREEQTFSHKKYDKTISHHRSYILNDFDDTPRRVVYYRAHDEGSEHHDVQNYQGHYETDFREAPGYQELQEANSESSLDYCNSEGHESSVHKLIVCENVNQQDVMSNWKERALQLEKGKQIFLVKAISYLSIEIEL